MSLLPLGRSVKNQKFAELLDVQSRCDYSSLDKNPLTCKASLLTHLAMSKSISIEGMLEREAREYIANADKIYNIKGTPQSILNALATIGLHTAESPARVVEYRDVAKDYTAVRKYDGTRKFDGSWKFLGTTVELSFTLEKWYQFGVIITIPTTRKKLEVAKRLILENKPARCELKALVTNKKRTYNGTWKFNNNYLFDASKIKRESEETDG